MLLHSCFLSSTQWCSSIGIQFTIFGFFIIFRFPLFFSHTLSSDSCFPMYCPGFIYLCVRVEFSSVVLFSAFFLRISALLTTFCWRNHLMFHGLGCKMLLQFAICDYSLWFANYKEEREKSKKKKLTQEQHWVYALGCGLNRDR